MLLLLFVVQFPPFFGNCAEISSNFYTILSEPNSKQENSSLFARHLYSAQSNREVIKVMPSQETQATTKVHCIKLSVAVLLKTYLLQSWPTTHLIKLCHVELIGLASAEQNKSA